MTPKEVVEQLRQDYAQSEHPDDFLPPPSEALDFSLDETEEDWFKGLTCNPNAPEECESCQ